MTTSTSATITPVLKKSLLYGSVLAIAVAIIGSVVGLIVAGVPGLVSALLGAAMAAVFMGLTAASLILANRVAPDGTNVGRFFAIVAGGGLLKFAAFTVAILLLGSQPWLYPYLFFWAMVAAVITIKKR